MVVGEKTTNSVRKHLQPYHERSGITKKRSCGNPLLCLGTYIYIHYMEEDLIVNLDNAYRASFNVLYGLWLLAELMNNLK